MIDLERILCPTDFTTQVDPAVRYSLALARAYGAELTVCYRPDQAELSSVATHSESRTDALAPVRSPRIFENVLLRFIEPESLRHLAWQGLFIEGEDVGGAIAETASEISADLIVMRSRRRPHRAALLGSTAESVCRTAPCPVLVTHTDERDWVQPLSRSISLQKVLVPYDFSDHSELALKYALSFTQEYQAELHLLHVLPPYTTTEPEIAWYPLRTGSTHHNAALRLQNAVPSEAHLWCKVKTVVSDGHPYREILNYAENNDIDLISLGAHGAGFGMRALFGSNVDRVLRQAPCPVLVARPLKPANFQIKVESTLELAAAV